METDAFDRMTRAFVGTHPRRMTRRGMTRLLGGLTLGGPLALLGLGEATAKCKKKCGPCKRCKKGKCTPKPAGTACAGGTCQRGACIAAAGSPPAQTCTDGIRNGSETDLDCGGTCPRCAEFKTCDSRDDCRSALCQAGVCRTCNLFDPDDPCGSDATGSCSCTRGVDGQTFCTQASCELADTCAQCPAGTICHDFGFRFCCFKPCGAS